jgi:hypothetical protein
MGKPVSDTYDGKLLDVSMETLRSLDSVRNLTPEDLKLFLEAFFSRMSISAKETIVELIWNSMSSREKHLFDMPAADHRLSNREIIENLSASQILVSPRRQQGRGAGNQSPNSLLENDTMSRTTGLGITRNRLSVLQSWPRVGLLRDGPTTVYSFGPSSTDTSQEPQMVNNPNQSAFLEGSRVEQRVEPAAVDHGTSTSGEDDIVNILMDVVMRAERAAIETSTIQRTFRAWRGESSNREDGSIPLSHDPNAPDMPQDRSRPPSRRRDRS